MRRSSRRLIRPPRHGAYGRLRTHSGEEGAADRLDGSADRGARASLTFDCHAQRERVRQGSWLACRDVELEEDLQDRKASPEFGYGNGRVRLSELHWYEAHGIGKKELNGKRNLD